MRKTQMTFLLWLLIGAVIANYLALMLFSLSINEFTGQGIDEEFPLALYSMPVYAYLLLSSQVLFFFGVNRLSVLLEKDPERSHNETIMKAKKFSAAGFIFGLLMLATLFLFIQTRFDIIINEYLYDASGAKESYMDIFDLEEDPAKALLDTHLIYAAVWVVIFGTFFIFGLVFTNFYVGRLISYYARQKYKKTKSPSWKIFQGFGYIWSLQFIISYFSPMLVSLIIFGALTLLFAIVILLFSRESLATIDFKSTITQMREKKPKEYQERSLFRRVVQISMVFNLLLVGILWFGATLLYSRNKLWFDWGFYMALGILILLIPIFSIFYAEKPVAQLLLKGTFLLFSLLGAFYFILAIFSYSDLLSNYVFALFFQGRIQYLELAPGFVFKPGQFMVLFLFFFTNMIALLGLKKNLVPLTAGEKRKIKDYFRIKNLSKGSKLFIACFAGMLIVSAISYNGMGSYIELKNDKDFTPQVAFWEWDSWTKQNETLEVMAEHEVHIYGGHPYGETYKANMTKYYNYGVKVRPTGDNYAWIDWIESEREKGWTTCPVDGFIEDIEDGGSLFEFNRTQNERERAEYEELIDYVHQHNFTQDFTAMHTTINDQLDGDLDVTIFHEIASFPPLDWDGWNWMIYRTESATQYEEESPYFTYQWVKELKDTVHQMYGGEYDDRLSVSVGVVEEDRLYGYEDGWEQFMLDLIICDYLKIPEIIIFNMGEEDESRFLGMWGAEGIEEMMEELEEWDTVKLYYSRSATFFGNIKYLENPAGSVFGNFWIDLFLDNSLIFFALTWIFFQGISYYAFIRDFRETHRKLQREVPQESDAKKRKEE